MPEVDVRRGGIDAEFHPQGLARGELLLEPALGQRLLHPELEDFQISHAPHAGGGPSGIRVSPEIGHEANARLPASAWPGAMLVYASLESRSGAFGSGRRGRPSASRHAT